ncbi:MAG: tautomerase family protein, partial [Ectothiorhodospiraceae bacterium]|nr:tautomerase family protein [Ectothiorhodospiraceae bacterium]
TVIEINMMQGRAPETQKALKKELFGKIESEVGISPVDLEVTIKEALISYRARVTVGFFAMLGAVRSAVVIPRSSAATTQREKSSCNPEGLGRFSPVAVSQATTGRTLPAAPCSWPRTKIGLERERGN